MGKDPEISPRDKGIPMNCLIPIGHFKNGVLPESLLSGAVTVIGRYLILSSFF